MYLSALLVDYVMIIFASQIAIGTNWVQRRPEAKHTFFFNVFVMSSWDVSMTLDSSWFHSAVSWIRVSSIILKCRILQIVLHFQHGFKHDYLNTFLQNRANMCVCVLHLFNLPSWIALSLLLRHAALRTLRVICTDFFMDVSAHDYVIIWLFIKACKD